MSYTKIDIDMFAEKVTQILKTYAETTAEQMNEIADSVSKETLQKVRDASPVRKKNGGGYKKGWARKADKSKAVNEYTIYNKTKPQLTHLLEKGHAVKPDPGPGKKTRVEGRPHIGPAEEWAVQEMVRRTVSKL